MGSSGWFGSFLRLDGMGFRSLLGVNIVIRCLYDDNTGCAPEPRRTRESRYSSAGTVAQPKRVRAAVAAREHEKGKNDKRRWLARTLARTPGEGARPEN